MPPKLFDKWLRKRGQTSFLIFDLQVTDMDVVFEVIGQLESFQISREELEVMKSSNAYMLGRQV